MKRLVRQYTIPKRSLDDYKATTGKDFPVKKVGFKELLTEELIRSIERARDEKVLSSLMWQVAFSVATLDGEKVEEGGSRVVDLVKNLPSRMNALFVEGYENINSLGKEARDAFFASEETVFLD